MTTRNHSLRASRPSHTVEASRSRAALTGCVLVALAAVSLLTGCGSTHIFNATFESDVVGAPPNTSPPEPPTEDAILTDLIGATPLQLSVVESPAVGGEKALRYAPTSGGFVSFAGRDVVADRNADLFAYWNGRLHADSSPLHIVLGDRRAGPLLELVLHEGQIRGRQADGFLEFLGFYDPDVNHLIVVSVDGAKEAWKIMVVQRGDKFTSNLRPVLNTGALGGTQPILDLQFEGTPGGRASYVIEGMVISRRPPAPGLF